MHEFASVCSVYGGLRLEPVPRLGSVEQAQGTGDRSLEDILIIEGAGAL